MTSAPSDIWPTLIACHGDVTQGGVFKISPPEWREPSGQSDGGPYYRDFRSCSYCGSMHPADLLRVVSEGARLHGADWKYGWPHKFYIDDIVNKIAGQICRVGGVYCSAANLDESKQRHPEAVNWRESEHGWQADLMGEAPTHLTAKWYNVHLRDLDNFLLRRVAKVIEDTTNIQFFIDDKNRLAHRAPYRGYQA